MTVYLSNAFSLSVLLSLPASLNVSEITIDDAKRILKEGFVSAVGHEATAQLASELLGFPVQFNRIQIRLERGDVLVVLQLCQRLPEGKLLSKEEMRSLPTKWLLVKVL